MPADPFRNILLNLAVTAVVSAILFAVWHWKKYAVYLIGLVFCLSSGIMSCVNISGINKELTAARQIVMESSGIKPELRLSKNGRNVIILMIDRSIGYYIPFFLNEKPVLQEQFAGFTYYPQTLSFASQTNEGLPPIYDGYEYRPEKMNERADVPLVEKHNEALRMMPVIFDEAGYEVTILEPSYANYQMPSDLHIYDDHPNINAYNLSGLFISPELMQVGIDNRNRNFFCYSLYKTSPLILQPSLYTYGFYNETDALANTKKTTVSKQRIENLLQGTGIRGGFEVGYSILTNLSNITVIEDSDRNTFTTFDNTATHEPALLQMPDYVPSPVINNTFYDKIPIMRKSIDGRERELDSSNQLMHYHVNMAAYLQLGKWMDYLRENGVYDNSRIIIVSDHGGDQGFPEYKFGKEWFEDVMYFNAVLMVKDFADDTFSVDDQFMTNADVPTIAMDGLIESPVNPSTGNPVTNEEKFTTVHKVHKVADWNVNTNDNNTFTPSNWYSFDGDDIYNVENWKFLGIF
jgi:hypothetical protein